MKYTKLTPEKLRSYLVGVFAEKDRKKMYDKDCQMYEGMEGFPLTRPAFVAEYGEAAVLTAEEGARADLEACRRKYEATEWPACFDAADCPPASAADDMPPAEGLYLYRVPADGVAVGGPASATYCARKSIRAHGARWNKGAQRWEAFTPEAINALCEWFGVTASRIA